MYTLRLLRYLWLGVWFGHGGRCHGYLPSAGSGLRVVVEVSLVLVVVELLPGVRESARRGHTHWTEVKGGREKKKMKTPEFRTTNATYYTYTCTEQNTSYKEHCRQIIFTFGEMQHTQHARKIFGEMQ